MAPMDRTVATDLTDLAPKLVQSEGFADLAAALNRGESAAVDGAWGSSCALVAAAIASGADRTLLAVVRRPSEVDDFAADLLGFLGEAPEILPAWDSLPSERVVTDPIYGGRLRVLARMTGPDPPRVVVTSFAALMQPVPGRAERAQGTRRLRVGDDL